MPSYCHSLPLPCGKDQSAWIEKGSDANPKINDSESSEEEKRIGHKKDMKNGIDDKKSLAAIKANSNNHRNLQIAAVSATKHSNTKDRCLNPNHVYEMMVSLQILSYSAPNRLMDMICISCHVLCVD